MAGTGTFDLMSAGMSIARFAFSRDPAWGGNVRVRNAPDSGPFSGVCTGLARLESARCAGQDSPFRLTLMGFTLARETVVMGESFRAAKYRLGQVVRHKLYEFRGVVFDVDPDFQNTEEWWDAIPEEARPSKDQPFYHLLAENETSYYVAYVSEQNLIPDETGEPVEHPEIGQFFGALQNGQYEFDRRQAH